MDTVTQSVGISRLLKPPLDASAPVCVFWDFENCHAPSDVDPDAIAGNIRAALLDYGLTGPLTICAYGNLAVLARRTQVGLINSGVSVRDVPPDGKKETTDKRILTDLMLHACDTPPPAHILLVSGDEDFAYGLHRLALRCYHVHVALNLEGGVVGQPALQRLTASGRAWQWQALVRGDVAPMPFTEALGVPTFPGVGQYRQSTARERALSGSVEDRPVFAPSKDEPAEAGFRAGRPLRADQPHPVPAAIKRQVAEVLDDAPPQGISMSELQMFLARKGFTLDYRGLGYKQLLTMMQAMPDTVAVSIPAERSTKKKYFLRPAAAPEFLRTTPSSKVPGGGLRADVSVEVMKEAAEARGSPQMSEVPENSGTSIKHEEEVGEGKSQREADVRDLLIKPRPLRTESKQRPLASLVQVPLFRKVLNSVGGLFGRRQSRLR
ncbi:hypothetical protein KFL_007760060 [Klebsormidium nitens]|uniref:HTH OST-type domain-containing protein n=1 Tax=Klebsormidium nitens TaxID=105231 RepID=A0A1Y1IRW1_KLENI|nr:hypothetical protein KFL_007760060 [Klebsormidium nitens]|eukprot:GAQ91387.1 hypothetical protein KFL_007760060 [Klebsormidium nitens]